AQQTINLSGISAGGGEQQPLRVTAVSSNPDLIADPTVGYTSDDATGTLTFTPVADQSGTSTITVTVEDGGLDGNLVTDADNLSTTEMFEIAVRQRFEWHNYALPEDVNNDGVVSPIDALLIIRDLNGGLNSFYLPETEPDEAYYSDVSKDQWLSPIDAIKVINFLNETSYFASIEITPMSLSGEPIHQIGLGEAFYLSLSANDLREKPHGITSAYTDVFYDHQYISVTSEPIFVSPYLELTSSNQTRKGTIANWGAKAPLKANLSTQLISYIPVRALKEGTVLLSNTHTADDVNHPISLLGLEDNLSISRVNFIPATLTIRNEDSAEGEWMDDAFSYYTDSSKPVEVPSSKLQKKILVEEPFQQNHLDNYYYQLALSNQPKQLTTERSSTLPELNETLLDLLASGRQNED
ncbi:MAG: hypothetical protein CMM02_19080, partial [Rhodopirellula sp.]|nr:hypothetical protein [Rhodopirellula sp.]